MLNSIKRFADNERQFKHLKATCLARGGQMDIFQGVIHVNNKDYPYVFSNFLLSVSSGKDEITTKFINTVIVDGRITLTDCVGDRLVLKISEYAPLRYGKLGFHVSGYMHYRDKSICTASENGLKVKTFSFQTGKSLMFEHPVIDCFLRSDKQFLRKCISVLEKWDDNENASVQPISPPLFEQGNHSFALNGKTYIISFEAMAKLHHHTSSAFTMQNGLFVECHDDMSIDEIFKVADIVKSFMKLIAQANIINLNEKLINYSNEFPFYESKLYLKPEGADNIVASRIFDYEDIQGCIGKIFELIASNAICFRSLFAASDTNYHMSDIINACAAFESQFRRIRPSPKFTQKKDVKAKLVALMENQRKHFNEDELDSFDELIAGYKAINVNVLREQLEMALDDFIKLIGPSWVEIGFAKDYNEMPVRFKKSRDAIAHGNLKNPLPQAAFTDTRLVRALTYMLILKEAGVASESIKNCIMMMSKYVSVD